MIDQRLRNAADGVRAALANVEPPPINDVDTVRLGDGGWRISGWKLLAVGVAAFVTVLVSVGAASWLMRGDGAPTAGEVPEWVETKLVASDARLMDWFGYAVDVDGERIVVGAPTRGGAYSGAVYVYDTDGAGGRLETKLTASDGSGGQFGMAVAVDGDRIVVGRPFAQDTQGSAYVFERSGDEWVETRLTAFDGAAGDEFGSSVAIDGDRIVIGAGGHDEEAGAVYVFDADGAGGWAETRIAAPEPDSSRNFGSVAHWAQAGVPVAVSGDVIVAGSSLRGDVGSVVFVFERAADGTWSRVTPPLSGHRAVVLDDRIIIGTESGVDVLERDDGGWRETRLWTEPSYDLAAADRRIVITTNPIVTSGTGESFPVFEDAPPVIVFESDGTGGWIETQFAPRVPVPDSDFGSAVAVDGDRIVIGAPLSQKDPTYSGAVYLYEAVWE